MSLPAFPRHRILLGLLLALGLVLPRASVAQEEPTVLFLVRHAEKALEPADDPPLTAAGEARARLLSDLLQDAGIEAVYSTDFVRTRSTGAPFAERSSLTLEIYNPRDLEGFASHLRTAGRTVLVVGHSNTTPALVGLLGGEPGPPIDEPAEYDRLYILTLTDGGVATTLLRFGSLFRPTR